MADENDPAGGAMVPVPASAAARATGDLRAGDDHDLREFLSRGGHI